MQKLKELLNVAVLMEHGDIDEAFGVNEDHMRDMDSRITSNKDGSISRQIAAHIRKVLEDSENSNQSVTVSVTITPEIIHDVCDLVDDPKYGFTDFQKGIVIKDLLGRLNRSIRDSIARVKGDDGLIGLLRKLSRESIHNH